MSLSLTPTQSRAAAVVLLILLVVFLAALVAVPSLQLHKRYDAYLDDYTDKLQRYQRVAAMRPVIEERMADIIKQDGRKYYLRSVSPTLAVAELQSSVTRIIEVHKGRILTSQVLPEKEELKKAGPLKVAIQVHFAASIVPLQLILHAVETHVPYLFVEKVTVSSSHGRAYKAEAGVQPEFNVNLTISGYAITEGSEP